MKRNKIIIIIIIFIVMIIGFILIQFVRNNNSNIPNGYYLKNTYYYEEGSIGDYFSFYVYIYPEYYNMNNILNNKKYKKVNENVDTFKQLFNQNYILKHYKEWIWDDNMFDSEDFYYLKEYNNEKYDLYYFNKESRELFFVEAHCD